MLNDLKVRQIGRVVNVAGSQVVALLEDDGAAGGESLARSYPKGSLIKLKTRGSMVFGVISSLSIPIPGQGGHNEMLMAELELLGEVMDGDGADSGGFRRGVSVFPALSDPVISTDQNDLAQVFARPAKSTVEIGTIYQDTSIPAFVGTDDLLGKHFAVIGTTGSGKSCAVALLLHRLLDQNPNAHVMLLDLHNEYTNAFGKRAEVLDPDTLQLPYWLFSFEELIEVVLGGDVISRSNDAEIAILGELIPQAKRAFSSDAPEQQITVDTPLPFRLSTLIELIDGAMGKLDKPESMAPYQRLKGRLNLLRNDSRYRFMFGGISVRDNMAHILSRLFRVPVDGKPITIVDLSGVPSEILNVVVSALCRISFDFALWSDRALPILLVCEEAHRYAPQDDGKAFAPAKKYLSRIAREGRKYGVSLCVVSQRPSDLSTSVLSQCNTIFSLRLTSDKDQDFVRSAMADSAIGLLDFLPALRNAEAVVVGEGVSVPTRMMFSRLEENEQPRSGTARFSEAWRDGDHDLEFVQGVVARWRNQKR